MKKRVAITDTLMILAILAITILFCVLGNLFAPASDYSDNPATQIIMLTYLITLLKCLIISIVFVALDIIRRRSELTVLKRWGSVLFCALPILIAIALYFANLGSVVAYLTWGIATWKELGLLLPVLIILWSIYQRVLGLMHQSCSKADNISQTVKSSQQ